MRRTLLAIGFAVLVSMLFAPHGDHWRALDSATFFVQGIRGYVEWTPEWYANWHWFPIFWIERRNSILWSNFVGQTAFVGVLAAMLVNLRRRRAK